jgi:hypothetical protein
MLFMRYAKYASETRRDLDTAKQNLEIVKAELDKQIRDNPEDFGITKITEGAIQSAILTNKNYSEAYKEFSVSKYEADMAQNAVTAMNTRKDMLEQLIKLYGQSYFAGPKVPRDLAKERSLKENKTDSGINKKLTRR